MIHVRGTLRDVPAWWDPWASQPVILELQGATGSSRWLRPERRREKWVKMVERSLLLILGGEIVGQWRTTSMMREDDEEGEQSGYFGLMSGSDEDQNIEICEYVGGDGQRTSQRVDETPDYTHDESCTL